MRRIVGTLCAALALAALAPSAALAQANAPAPAYYQQPYQARDTWYIGFGLGSGGGSYSYGGQSWGFTDGLSNPVTLALQFEVGATLRPDLLLGFDLRALRSQGSVNGVDTGVQATDYLAMLTWFPQGRGFFVRGGLGLASLTFDQPGTSNSETAGGVSALIGVGYAFWLGQHFNLTLNLDASGQAFADSTTMPTSSRFIDAYLGFTWY